MKKCLKILKKKIITLGINQNDFLNKDDNSYVGEQYEDPVIVPLNKKENHEGNKNLKIYIN